MGKGKKQEGLSDQTLNLRRRLHEALSLGLRLNVDKEKKWQCTDGEIQIYALRAMSAFINCMPSAPLKHNLIKESISDMMLTLEGILRSENERILSQAVELTLKLVNILGKSICQFHMMEIMNSLALLLSARQVSLACSCAVALNHILTHLGSRAYRHNSDVWKSMERTNTVGNVISAMHDYEDGSQPIEYFIEMASLLKTMISRWSPFRYHAWSNPKLMDSLLANYASNQISISVKVLQLCSALALCGNLALKILEKKEFLCKIMQSMGSSQPDIVRIEGLKLCEHLARSAEGCSLLVGSYCECIVREIISAVGGWRSSHAQRVPSDQMLLVIQACRTALMTRCAGKHHSWFWNLEIDCVLLDNLIGNYTTKCQTQPIFSSDELRAKIYDNIGDTGPYLWDVLGWLVTYCNENFVPKTKGKICCLDILISCACAVMTDLMQKGRSSLSFDIPIAEPVVRAVLMMVLSPSRYIASKARSCLFEMAKPNNDGILHNIFGFLKELASRDVSLVSNSLQTALNLIGLTCYSTLPQCQSLIVKKKGLEIISAIIRRCFNSDIRISRSSIVSHLHHSPEGSTCCWDNLGDWEGKDILLFYSLQALAQLLSFSNFTCDHYKITSREITATLDCSDCEACSCEARSLISSLHSILNNNLGAGPRWYASYIFSFFGFYGFPSRLGKRMEKALTENELADLQFILSNGQPLTAHSAVLKARCPYLLPSEETILKNKVLHGASINERESQQNLRKLKHEVRISDRVDYCALIKILEYTYTGFFLIEDHLLKPLIILANACGLKSLSHMLYRRLPRWGSASPSCDFTRALEPTENSSFDVVLEAKESGVVRACNMCQLSNPHIHAHKIILWASCDYLRALFGSGMHESYSQIIKVPIGWNALFKLVRYFYSGELPRIKTDCTWHNLDANLQLLELQAYVELSSLSEFWMLEEIGEESLDIVVSCLKLDMKSLTELIHYALNLSQWKIVETAVSSIAHLYPKLRDGGELGNFSEEVVEMLRTEYVNYSQKVQ